MRSRASYNSHPIHPAIIPFPFAFLTGAFFFDLVAWMFGWEAWWTTGGHLAVAGILTAFVAAVPGLIDYLYTVPPHSTGKQRATRHMLTNLSAVVVMIVAWTRRDSDLSVAILAIELAGVGLLWYGSFMGGVLVSRNQISIDHRYAEAGKWKEITVDTVPGKTIEVATSDELKPNQMKLLRIGGMRLVLARTHDAYVIFDDRCTHRGGTLAGGTMICDTVQCPWHGSQFDVRTGAVEAGPAKQGIETYKVETREGKVFLTL